MLAISGEVGNMRRVSDPSLLAAGGLPMANRVNYRKLAFSHYDPLCANCGFGVQAVLEVAHIDCAHTNNQIASRAKLCSNCHKMHDLDLILTETILQTHDRPKVVNWGKRMKDAGLKAAISRLRREAARN